MAPTTPDADPTSEPAFDPGIETEADDPSDLATTLAGRTFLSSHIDGHTLLPGTQIRLSFQVSTVSAAAGCNTLGYDASYDDAILTVTDGLQTEEGCGDELEAQDVWLGSYLRSEPTLSIDGDTLTVATADVVITLVDREAAEPDHPLAGTTWIVDGLINAGSVSSVPEASAASITIANGRAAVYTGCNRGGATVEVGDETITFGPMATTKMACAPASMDLEFAVTSVLDGLVGYSIEAGRLTITRQGGDGETIGLSLTAE